MKLEVRFQLPFNSNYPFNSYRGKIPTPRLRPSIIGRVLMYQSYTIPILGFGSIVEDFILGDKVLTG